MLNKKIMFLIALLAPPVMAAKFTPANLPANGFQESILSVNKFAYYAIMAKSQQGVAFSVVDPMAGPSSLAGSVGEQDGRINQFLDPGKYKIRLQAHEKGQGNVQLIARPYKELNQSSHLVELKWVKQSLRDFQQRSFWIEIKQRKTIHIEAAGRSLSSLKLWHNGNWLMDINTSSEVVDPKPGEPVNLIHLVADLNPGLYLLSAYGGPSLKWSKDNKNHDFYLRYGIPELSEAARQFRIAGPIGIDRFKVPASANFFQLELPESEEAVLRLNSFSENNPFQKYGQEKSISKKSRIPVAKLRTSTGSDWHMLTVTRESGKPYLLQHFQYNYQYHFSHSGRYWLSALHAGHADDQAPITPILIRNTYRNKLIAARAIPMDRNSHYTDQFNLLNTTSLHLEIKQAGRYTFSHSKEDAQAEYQLMPFFVNRPRNFREPDFQSSGYAWQVDPGYYVLTIRPKSRSKGVLNLRIKGSAAKTPQILTHTWRMPNVSLSHNRYILYLNKGEVEQGVILREYPINMNQDLPLMLNKDQSQGLRVEIPEAGILSARSDDGLLLPIKINGKTDTRHKLKAASYLVNIKNDKAKNLFVNLHFEKSRLMSNSELPRLSQELLASIPVYPQVNEKRAEFFDLQRQQWKIFTLQVNNPGLYRLESSGLLHTHGYLRSRLLPALNKSQKTGVGRNFLVQEYLRPGQYQIRVQTQGKTQGHLGVHLRHTQVHEGGQLQLSEIARHTLKRGEAIKYSFVIRDTANYKISAIGLHQNFRMRLEDAGGWPLLTPGIPANIELELRPGKYFILILPQALESRILTKIDKIQEDTQFSGHGPHSIQLNQGIKHLWLESEKRTEDQWRFHLNAEADISIQLSPKMHARLMKGNQIIKLGRRPWNLRLQAGNYSLLTSSIRPNNRLDYSLTLSSKQLLSGMQRAISENKIEISNAKHQLIELSSYGQRDISAVLKNKHGQVILKSDDRNNDWNFLIQKKLDRGMYDLYIEGNHHNSVISFSTPIEIEHNQIRLPAKLNIDQKGVNNYYLPALTENRFFIAKAAAKHDVGLDIEYKKGNQWISLGVQTHADKFVAVALNKKHRYRLRVWSLRNHNINIQLHANLIKNRITQENNKTLQYQNFTLSGKTFGLATVQIKKAGIFRISQKEDLYWSSSHKTLSPLNDNNIAIKKGLLWIISNQPRERVKLSRLHLGKPKNITVSVQAGQKVNFDLANKGEQVIIARSLNGFPGIDPVTKSQVSAFDGNASLLYLPKGGGNQARLWIADAQQALSIDLHHVNLREQSSTRFSSGIKDFSVQAGKSFSIALPKVKQVQVIIPERTGFAVFQKNQHIATYWAHNQAQQYSVDLKSGKLVFFNLDKHEKQMQLTAFRTKNSLSQVAANSAFTHLSSASQSFMIPVRSEKPATLRLRGQFYRALFMDDAGRLQQGSNLMIRSNGKLLVHAKPGWFMANLEFDKMQKTASSFLRLKGNKEIALKGGSKSLSIRAMKHSLLHLESATPMIIEHIDPQGSQNFYDFVNGANYHQMITKGDHTFTLYPLFTSLSGKAYLRESSAISIKDGLGPKLQLAPGQSRLFVFTVKTSGKVGIGIKANQDLLNSRLYSAEGNKLGEGVIQLHKLEASSYYLEIEAAADLKNNISFQTALVGINKPSTQPPQEVIKNYIKLNKVAE